MGPPTRSRLATWSNDSRSFCRPVSSATISRKSALARAALKSAWARSALISAMRWRLPVDQAIGIDVDDLGIFIAGAGGRVGAVDVRMAVEHQPRLKDVEEMPEGLEPGVGRVGAVVNAERRGVRHQDIEAAPEAHPVGHERRGQA